MPELFLVLTHPILCPMDGEPIANIGDVINMNQYAQIARDWGIDNIEGHLCRGMEAANTMQAHVKAEQRLVSFTWKGTNNAD